MMTDSELSEQEVVETVEPSMEEQELIGPMPKLSIESLELTYEQIKLINKVPRLKYKTQKTINILDAAKIINDKKYDVLFNGLYSNFCKLQYLKINEYEMICKTLRTMYLNVSVMSKKNLTSDFKIEKNGFINSLYTTNFNGNKNENKKPDFKKELIYDFKKNGDYRRTYICNFFVYFIFISNTIKVENELFSTLYENVESEEICCVLSKIYEKGFRYQNYRNQDFGNFKDGVEYSESASIKAKLSSKYLYNMKLDIADFYSSIYTHSFERIARAGFNKVPFNAESKRYIEWLDDYNKQINERQTNGIITGIYSSQICGEILSIAIDYEIIECIKKLSGDNDGFKIQYTRYCDDYIFFCNKKPMLETLKNKIEKILGKYNLILNSSKTSYGDKNVTKNQHYLESRNMIDDFVKQFEGIEIEKKEKVDKKEVHSILSDFLGNMENYCSERNYSAFKSANTLLNNKVLSDEKIFYILGGLDILETLMMFLFKISLLHPNLSYSCMDTIALIDSDWAMVDYEYFQEYKKLIKEEFDGTVLSLLLENILGKDIYLPKGKKQFTYKLACELNALQSIAIISKYRNVKNDELKALLLGDEEIVSAVNSIWRKSSEDEQIDYDFDHVFEDVVI